MKSTALIAAIAAILVAGLALAGCNRDANDAADRDVTPATDATGDMPPATTDTSAMDTDATATGLTVTTVDLGSAVGDDNRGWPTGTYRLEISNNGMVVQTREFEVQ